MHCQKRFKQTSIMEITKDYLKRKHAEFNKEYFGGCLPNVFFIIGKNKRTLGYYRHRQFGLCDIMISTFYDRTERDFCRTLLHEMIHQYIAVKGLRDSSLHGKYFKSYANMLNDFGWNITAREAMPTDITTTKTHEYNVLRFKEKSGTYFVFVSASNMYDEFFRRLSQANLSNGHFAELERFKSTNPIFSSFVQCRSRISGKRITKEELSTYR